ncbi:unnamed protein product [Prorocentrum cordatum]|uniref:Beta-glucosidase n=1 Tax=Prorocentrum cordatum TaxID=2364126 RepID=A0ABN9X3E7_9DINO|nr:unnamed protein product [Polarella glacialis]
MARGFAIVASLLLRRSASFDDDEAYIASAFQGDANFLWGSATAAAQIEGAWNISGKQASTWDDFCHSIPHRDTTDPDTFSKTCGRIPEGQSGSRWVTLDVTDDFFHTYNADIDLLSVEYGMNAMRMSMSWPRLMPLNKSSGKHEVNPEGVQFYKDVFAMMKKRGVTPFVTLHHWDVPNDLSWLEDDIVNHFLDFAKLCFNEFPEITNWATVNEPNSICSGGYGAGVFAPGHKSTTDHLVCGHHILQAHARSVDYFRKSGKKGHIGIVLDYKWAYPNTDSEADNRAAAYDRDNLVGFWAEPIFKTGDYPQSLKDFFGAKMPVLTDEEKYMLKGSADFWGLNTYGGHVAVWNDKKIEDYEPGDNVVGRYSFSPCSAGADQTHVDDHEFECGAASGWLWAKPDSMRKYLNWVKDYYGVENIIVTEFGVDVANESDMSMDEALVDTYRQEYYKRYLKQIAVAKKEDGVAIRGVFAWSLMDNFEWADGLNFRFGITYVDFNDLSRHPKMSAKWWTKMIARMKSEPPPRLFYY